MSLPDDVAPRLQPVVEHCGPSQSQLRRQRCSELLLVSPALVTKSVKPMLEACLEECVGSLK